MALVKMLVEREHVKAKMYAHIGVDLGEGSRDLWPQCSARPGVRPIGRDGGSFEY